MGKISTQLWFPRMSSSRSASGSLPGLFKVLRLEMKRAIWLVPEISPFRVPDFQEDTLQLTQPGPNISVVNNDQILARSWDDGADIDARNFGFSMFWRNSDAKNYLEESGVKNSAKRKRYSFVWSPIVHSVRLWKSCKSVHQQSIDHIIYFSQNLKSFPNASLPSQQS
jgi:hypothetical protein